MSKTMIVIHVFIYLLIQTTNILLSTYYELENIFSIRDIVVTLTMFLAFLTPNLLMKKLRSKINECVNK